MHGQALMPNSHGDRSSRLVEPPTALGYGDDLIEEPAWNTNLHALWLNIARDRVLMLRILLLALAVGAATIWLAKPVYSARATIQITPPASLILSTENIAPDAGRTENDRALQTQIDLLASRPTAEKVAKKLKLASNPLFLREVGLGNEPAGPKRNNKVITALLDRLSLSSPRDTRIVDVRFDSHDPVAAARIANAFAATFIGDSLKRRLDNYDFSRRILHGQLEATDARFDQSARNLVNYARSEGFVDAGKAAGLASSGGKRRSIAAARLDDLNADYLKAQANRMEAEQRWQQAISTPAMSNPSSIIDRAQTPSLPAYPRPAMTMALAALAGVAFALSAAISRGRMDDEVHGTDDVERDFDAPLLGIVPMPKDGEDFALALSDTLSPGTDAHHAVFLALDRIVRTADHSVLLLTSSYPHEGKSMIALKLSANFAATGKKVLVIDADMRRGSLHRILDLPNQPGLADLLANDSSEALADVAQYCADRGFWVIPRGQPVTNPSELLASRRFADLLDEAVDRFDEVIMDGPPVLGLADAPPLSGMADATVFVLQANRTPREHAKLAMRRLAEAGSGQVGLVITTYESAKDSGAADPYIYVHAAEAAEEFVPDEPRHQAEQELQFDRAV